MTINQRTDLKKAREDLERLRYQLDGIVYGSSDPAMQEASRWLDWIADHLDALLIKDPDILTECPDCGTSLMPTVITKGIVIDQCSYYCPKCGVAFRHEEKTDTEQNVVAYMNYYHAPFCPECNTMLRLAQSGGQRGVFICGSCSTTQDPPFGGDVFYIIDMYKPLPDKFCFKGKGEQESEEELPF